MFEPRYIFYHEFAPKGRIECHTQPLGGYTSQKLERTLKISRSAVRVQWLRRATRSIYEEPRYPRGAFTKSDVLSVTNWP